MPLLDVFDADEDMELDENVSDSPSDDWALVLISWLGMVFIVGLWFIKIF